MSEKQYTERDRIKFACFNQALEQGVAEADMAEFFTRAATRVRQMEKTAFVSTLGGGAGALTALALAVPTLQASSALGYGTGQALRRAYEGRIPDPNEIHLDDETAAYDRAVDEIRQRIALNRIRKAESQVPSNRRMF